jgi:hypothetical protein
MISLGIHLFEICTLTGRESSLLKACAEERVEHRPTWRGSKGVPYLLLRSVQQFVSMRAREA